MHGIEFPTYKCYHLQLDGILSGTLGTLPPYYNSSTTSGRYSHGQLFIWTSFLGCTQKVGVNFRVGFQVSGKTSIEYDGEQFPLGVWLGVNEV